jgi:hypothetical protein
MNLPAPLRRAGLLLRQSWDQWERRTGRQFDGNMGVGRE